MVIFYSYVSLPEGTITMKLCWHAWPAFSNTDESTEGPDWGDRALQHAMQLRDGSFLNFHGLFGWLRQCHDDTKRWCSSYCYCSCTSGWMVFFSVHLKNSSSFCNKVWERHTYLSWIGFRRTCSDKNSVTSWFNMIEGGLLPPWCRSYSSYRSAVAVGKYWHLCETSIILTTASGLFLFFNSLMSYSTIVAVRLMVFSVLSN